MGYVLGGWATHKERGRGVYFWTFTHLASGMSVSVYPCHEVKASALAHLVELVERGPAPHVAALLAKHGGEWGGLGSKKVEA